MIADIGRYLNRVLEVYSEREEEFNRKDDILVVDYRNTRIDWEKEEWSNIFDYDADDAEVDTEDAVKLVEGLREFRREILYHPRRWHIPHNARVQRVKLLREFLFRRVPQDLQVGGRGVVRHDALVRLRPGSRVGTGETSPGLGVFGEIGECGVGFQVVNGHPRHEGE